MHLGTVAGSAEGLPLGIAEKSDRRRDTDAEAHTSVGYTPVQRCTDTETNPQYHVPGNRPAHRDT